MPKVVACIIARTVSTRLPLKVLRDFYPNISMLDFLIKRIKRQNVFDEVYLCTSMEAVDDIMEDVAFRNGIKIYRGSADAVIERMLAVGEMESADVLVRITGDNPFTAVELVELQLKFLLDSNLDYVRVTDLPIGGSAEIFTRSALVRCNELMDPDVSEYLLLFLFEPNHFRCGVVKAFDEDFSSFSLTVDTPVDFKRSKIILEKLKTGGFDEMANFHDVISIVKDNMEELPSLVMVPSGMVKMPYDVVISYEEFKNDMQRRIENSLFLKR